MTILSDTPDIKELLEEATQAEHDSSIELTADEWMLEFTQPDKDGNRYAG